MTLCTHIKTMRQPPRAIRSNAELQLTPARWIRPGRSTQPRRAGGRWGVHHHYEGPHSWPGWWRSRQELPGHAEAWGGLPKSSTILISAGLLSLAQGGCREPESCFALDGLELGGGRGVDKGKKNAAKLLPLWQGLRRGAQICLSLSCSKASRIYN